MSNSYTSFNEFLQKCFPDSKLENLAIHLLPLTNGRYKVNPNKNNPETGSIRYGLKGPWMFFEESKLMEKIKEFYNKEDYSILIGRSGNEVNIYIMENFIKKPLQNISLATS